MTNSLRDFVSFVNVTFDVDTSLNSIVKNCDEDTCDENAAFNNPKYYNRIVNTLKELRKTYEEKILQIIVYCLCYGIINFSFILFSWLWASLWVDTKYCSLFHKLLLFSMNSIKTIAKIVCKEDSSTGKSIFHACPERMDIELIENGSIEKYYQ